MIDKSTYKAIKEKLSALESELSIKFTGLPEDENDFDSNILLILYYDTDIPKNKINLLDDFSSYCLYEHSTMTMFSKI